MKIFSDTFRKWIRVIETYQTKGNPIGECIYFDFKSKLAYFGSQEGVGNIQFFTEEDEDIPNFFISINKFLNIITQYDYVYLHKDFTFTYENDKYKIPVILDDEKFDASVFATPFQTETRVDIEKNSIELISRALSFTSKDDTNVAYRNIFIKDNMICSLTTQTPLYEAPIGIDKELALPLSVARSLIQIGTIAEGCYLLSGINSKMIVAKNEELKLIVPSNSEKEFPSNREDKFIESYINNKKLEVQYDVFSKTLQMLRPYFSDVLNAKVKFIFDSDIEIVVQDSKNEIVKHCAYESIDPELVGKEFAISGSKIELALSVLKGKKLYIGLPDEGPIVNFWNDETQHILIVRFKN